MKTCSMAVALAVVTPFCAAVSAYAGPPISKAEPQDLAAAPSAHQFQQRQGVLEQALAPIKSKADLDRYLSTAADSPLDWLSSNAKWEFIGGLVFSDRGLASFRYDVLAKELTPTQIYQVLSLFGVQRTTPMIKGAKVVTETDRLIAEGTHISSAASGGRRDGEDYDNYWCSSKATCSSMMDSICISSNC